jgi:hypothetical protein
MKQCSDGATVLLGMSEFVVGVQLAVGRELWLLVETTADVVGCEGCGTRAVGHGCRRLKVRDLPMADRPHTTGRAPEPVLGGLHCQPPLAAGVVEQLGTHHEPVESDQRGPAATVAFHQGPPIDVAVNSHQ